MWGEKFPNYEKPADIIESAMKKVADIDIPNVGYSAIGRSAIGRNEPPVSAVSSIIRDGILGFDQSTNEKNPAQWARVTRTRGDNAVYFNIVGRAKDTIRKDLKNNQTEIGRSFYFRPGPSIAVAVLFDLHSFVEQEPQNRGVREHRDIRTFRSDDSSVQAESNRTIPERLRDIVSTRDRAVDARGRPRPHSEFGFILSHRVPPRLFTGIVFQIPRKKTPEELRRDIEGFIRDGLLEKSTNISEEISRRLSSPMEVSGDWTLEHNPEILREKAREIAEEMSEQLKKTPERSIPIYDSLGNLWWPKVMTREQIQLLHKA